MKARVYLYKYLFFWVAWVMEKTENDISLYYDNQKTVTVTNNKDIAYFRIGFRRKSMSKKLMDFCKKRYVK